MQPAEGGAISRVRMTPISAQSRTISRVTAGVDPGGAGAGARWPPSEALRADLRVESEIRRLPPQGLSQRFIVASDERRSSASPVLPAVSKPTARSLVS